MAIPPSTQAKLQAQLDERSDQLVRDMQGIGTTEAVRELFGDDNIQQLDDRSRPKRS